MYLNQLLAQHAIKQQFYFNNPRDWADTSIDRRAALLKDMMSYIVEETVEVNRELNHYYKSFKPEKDVDSEKLLEELCDLFIYWMGAVAIAGFSPEQTTQKIAKKLDFNDTRPDHSISEALYHYTYELTLKSGLKYIGVRSSPVPPAKDNYMGSSKLFNRSQVVSKRIINVYNTRKHAERDEAKLLWAVDAAKNPKYANVRSGSDPKEYKFKHDSGLISVCCPYDLANKHQLKCHDVGRVVRGERKSVKGWRLVNE